MGAPRRPIPATKVCTKCHRELPFTREYFPPCGPSQRHLGGLYPVCRECARAKRREWGQRNRDRLLARRRADHAARVNAGARRRGAQGRISNELVFLLYEIQRGRCYYCDDPLNHKFHIDHLVPLARGGTNRDGNIRLACADCNHSKWASTIEEWRERCPTAAPMLAAA